MPLAPVLDSIDLYTADTAVTRVSRTHAWIEAAVAEAIKAWPVSNRSDATAFSSVAKFNKALRKTFKCLEQPLTHEQWHYLLLKADNSIGSNVNVAGHLTTERIFTCPYSSAVHQILVVYASTVGLAMYLKSLNKSNPTLHSNSEGQIIANDAIIELLNPSPTSHEGSESLTSKTIRNQSSPLYVTGHIKLWFKNYIDRMFQSYEQCQTKLNPVSTVELLPETADPSSSTDADPHTKWKPLWKITADMTMRYEEVEELLQRSVSDLNETALTSDDQIDALSAIALDRFSMPENQMLISDSPTFESQVFRLLAPDAVSRYIASRVAKNIVSFFQEVLAFQFYETEETLYEPKNYTTRRVRNSGRRMLPASNGKAAEWIHRTTTKQRFTSHYVTESDYNLLLMMLHHGRFFI